MNGSRGATMPSLLSLSESLPRPPSYSTRSSLRTPRVYCSTEEPLPSPLHLRTKENILHRDASPVNKSFVLHWTPVASRHVLQLGDTSARERGPREVDRTCAVTTPPHRESFTVEVLT